MGGREDTYAEHNERLWDERLGAGFGARARAQWAAEPHWGIFGASQAELPFFPEELTGLDIVELGCGTAYVSAWAARAGARPVGVDLSERQLATARAMQHEFGLDFPLIHAGAEQVPLPDASFDLAVSEHGASAWCDPHAWIPEAARLLRPGGRLVYLRNSTLLTLCLTEDFGSATDRLQRDQHRLHRVGGDGADSGVTFHLPAGEMVGVLRRVGFSLEELIECRAPDGADPDADFGYVTGAWAARWPAEELWKARKTAADGVS